MSGFASDLEMYPNELETLRRELLSRGVVLRDLVSGNFVQNGITFPSDVLREGFVDYIDHRSYIPDSKGLLSAREAIANYYIARGWKEFSADQVFITASTSESYSLLFSLLCDPGDNILVPVPSYPLFEFIARHSKVQLANYQLISNNDRQWMLDKKSFNSITNRTRAVIVVSPHNPTGWICDEEIEHFFTLGIPLILDEVFSEFKLKSNSIDTKFDTISNEKIPICLLNGISKIFALPDLKLGWICLNRIAIELWGERLVFLNDTFLSANMPTQYVMPRLFDHGFLVTKKIRERIAINLEILRGILLGSGFDVSYSGAGPMLIIRLPSKYLETAIVRKMLELGFLVHPGYFYDMERGEAIVVSLVTATCDLEAGMRALVGLGSGQQ